MPGFDMLVRREAKWLDGWKGEWHSSGWASRLRSVVQVVRLQGHYNHHGVNCWTFVDLEEESRRQQ